MLLVSDIARLPYWDQNHKLPLARLIPTFSIHTDTASAISSVTFNEDNE